MGFVEGVSWSLAGAVAHTGIDVLRKLGSQKMAPVDLVALVTVYDAIFATAGVLAVEGSLPDISKFTSKSQFLTVVFITSSLAVLARVLYQRALSIAPLSLTVPYLAFTPAFVVLVSPLFLIGEIPSPVGMLGVFIVSISGYTLGLVTTPGSSDQPNSPSKAKLPLAVPSVHRSSSASTLQQLQHEQKLQEQHEQQPYSQQQQQQQFQEELRDHNHRRIGDGHHSKRGSSKSSQLSVWAMAYYKGKAPKSVLPAADTVLAGDSATNGPAGLQQWVTGSKHGAVDSSRYDNSSSSNTYKVVANGSSSWAETGKANWDDSQAKLSKDARADGKTAAALAASRAARLIGQSAHRVWGRQQLAACVAAVTGPNAAPAMVLSVAFLYSLTASLDKLGIAAANHSLAAYFLGQRLLIGICGVFYLLFFARSALRHIFTNMLLLCSISLVEQLAVVFYLIAINNLLVSYVVAIKRINVLLSTLIGCVLFNERVGKRIPYIVVMLCGMLMIVLQPGHEDLHHNHHTRHHMHHMSLL